MTIKKQAIIDGLGIGVIACILYSLLAVVAGLYFNVWFLLGIFAANFIYQVVSQSAS